MSENVAESVERSEPKPGGQITNPQFLSRVIVAGTLATLAAIAIEAAFFRDEYSAALSNAVANLLAIGNPRELDYFDPRVQQAAEEIVSALKYRELQHGCIFVTVAATVIWHSVCVSNYRCLGFNNLSQGPVLALLGWVIPVYNFLGPALSLRQLQKVGDSPRESEDWKQTSTSPFAWLFIAGFPIWTLSLTTQVPRVFIAIPPFYMGSGGWDPEIAADVFSSIINYYYAATFACGIPFIFLVRRITQGQLRQIAAHDVAGPLSTTNSA